MQIFMRWLYYQKLENMDPPGGSNPKWALRRGQFLDLYKLGYRYDVSELRNDVLRYIQVQYGNSGNKKLPISFFHEVFDKLPASSLLCRWLIQHFAHYWNPAADREAETAIYEDLPQEFLLDVALARRKHFIRFCMEQKIKESTCWRILC
jgi:hypothetical protein